MEEVLAIGTLSLALIFGAAFQSSNSVPVQLQAILRKSLPQSKNSGLEAKVDSLINNGPRKFYLTKTYHNGAQALSACATGYHMASMWEIHQPSNLRYDTDLGFIVADSGFGPPVLHRLDSHWDPTFQVW